MKHEEMSWTDKIMMGLENDSKNNAKIYRSINSKE